MTASTPEDAAAAFGDHEAFEPAETGYRITSTPFDSRVEAAPADADWALTYTVTIRVPTIESAAEEAVGPAVVDGWLETFERRLEDAPKATRATVDLDTFGVETTDGTAVVTYEFTFGDPARAAEVAKTFVEYVEGTYVEGVVPGYDYGAPVSSLLDQARSGGAEGERGGTPL